MAEKRSNMRLIPVFLFLCMLGFSGAARAGCDFMAGGPQPEWVRSAPEVADRYVGAGFAENMGDREKQVNASLGAAMKNLSTSISISVKSRFAEVLGEQVQKGKRVSTASVESITETTTDELVHDARVSGQWLDQQRCVLWTMVEVPKASVTANKRFKLVVSDLESAKKAAARDALAMLTEAESVLPQIDFAWIRDGGGREHYQNLLTAALEKVRAELKRNENIVFAMEAERTGENAVELPDIVMKKILSGLAEANPHYMDRSNEKCGSEEECLEKAAAYGGKNLMLVKCDASIKQGNLGAFKGSLTLEVVTYSVADRAPLRPPFRMVSQVVSPFGKEDLDWGLAADKMVKSGKLLELAE